MNVSGAETLGWLPSAFAYAWLRKKPEGFFQRVEYRFVFFFLLVPFASSKAHFTFSFSLTVINIIPLIISRTSD